MPFPAKIPPQSSPNPIGLIDCPFRDPGRRPERTQGGAIFAGGDRNFAYGLIGATPEGTEQSNRGSVNLNRVVIADTTSLGDGATGGLPGVGGGILGTFIDLTMTDSMIINNYSNNSSAGIQLVDNSVANLIRTTIANCTSEDQGTAITLYGASMNMSDSNILNNTINGTARGVAHQLTDSTLWRCAAFDSTVVIKLRSRHKGLARFWGGDSTSRRQSMHSTQYLFPPEHLS